jgi:hypothetical protein
LLHSCSPGTATERPTVAVTTRLLSSCCRRSGSAISIITPMVLVKSGLSAASRSQTVAGTVRATRLSSPAGTATTSEVSTAVQPRIEASSR